MHAEMHVRAPGEEESALKEDSGMRDDDGLSLQLTQIMTVWERRHDFPEVFTSLSLLRTHCFLSFSLPFLTHILSLISLFLPFSHAHSLQLAQIMTVWERREDFPEVAVPPDSLSLYLSASLSFSPSL